MLKKNKDTKRKKIFWERVRECSDMVATWPKWKRELTVSAKAGGGR